ncbi:MAG: MSCRAMM family protein [Candidatus Sumerlaeaceae bacterium]
MMKRDFWRWLLVGAGVLVLYIALAALRQQVSRKRVHDEQANRPPTEEEQYDEDYARRRTRTIVATEFSRGETPPPSLPKTKIVRLDAPERGESFEAEKLRTFGESAIYGTVRGPNRHPLAGVKVELYDLDPMTKYPPLREAVTDTSGTYKLDQINASERSYILIARAEGYAPFAKHVALRAEPLEQNLTLSEGVECAGVVVDALTSLPIARAAVYYPMPGAFVFRPLGTVETSAMGEFRFPHVARGSVKILVECAGYVSAIVRVDTPSSDTVIALRAGGAIIRGETISRLSQKPQGRAKVAAIMDGLEFVTTTFSDEQGRFEFENLPAGNFTLFGYLDMLGPPERVKLGEREVRENVRVIVPAPLFVSGRVVHAFNGNALPGVRVYYPAGLGRGVVTSDENGLFAFATYAVDSYWIEVHEKGFLPLLERRTTGSVERIERKIRRSDASDQLVLRLRPVPCIEGVVKYTDRNGKAAGPAASLDVQVGYRQRDILELIRTRTNALGEFFVNLPSGRKGTAKIVVPYRNTLGFASLRIPTRRPVEIKLERQRMNGRLFLSDATPLAGVEVSSQYRLPDGSKVGEALALRAASAFVRPNGSFSLAVAPKQKVELVFTLPDGSFIVKAFDTADLLGHSYTFVYDPLSKDIIYDSRGK